MSSLLSDTPPKISLVLLAFNQESLVRESIDSVLSQDYENLEILLSDDCSTDRTYELMLEAYNDYSGPHRLLLNRNDYNMGIGPHVHHAVSLTSSDYIVMAAGDDISLPGRVSHSVNVLRREGDLGCVIGRYHPFTGVFNDSGGWQPKHAKDGFVLRGGSEDWFKLFGRGKLVGTPGAVAMWNRKLFSLFDPIPRGVIAEDVVLANRCLIAGLGAGFTAQKFALYRQHAQNVYAGVSKSNFEGQVFFTRALAMSDLRSFRKKYPDQHSGAYWKNIEKIIEGTLYRSIVQIRKPYIGWFKSRLLFLLGLRPLRSCISD